MKNRTTIYIDNELKKKLKMYCADREITISQLISELLEKYLTGRC